MKFSYNWINELVDGLDTDAVELSRLITMKTAESDGVESYGAHLANVRAARVISAEPISGSKNQKAVVDTGKGNVTVVCGAPNCRAGIVTAYVPSGTTLGGREIRKTTIGGVESDGMLASGEELGLNRDHSGILELDLKPGAALPLKPDSVIEIDNKSLTHRPDLWGHYGMAREVSAILKKPLIDPVRTAAIPGGPAVVDIAIENFDLCPRYSALMFENVTVQPSPLWLQYRLQAIGLNPINNIVDVTNFIMAELAQPMHAFDAEKIRGGVIFVRSARDGEAFTALNDESYTLTPANLVIADEGGPIALAGVMGGLDSAISAGTTKLIFESACFHAGSVRKTASALKLRTDASMRFEKSQDPENTVRGLARAVDLLHEVSPGIRLVGGLADQYRPLPGLPPIDLPLDWLDRKLGRTLAAEEVRSILEALQFGVTEKSPRVFAVTVPSWRATKDVSMKDDLVEEVGRMIGYASITPQAPSVPVRVPLMNQQHAYHNRIRGMAAAQGFTEVSNYSFLSDRAVLAFGLDPADHIRVANPIAEDQSLMRISLVPGIARNIQENAKYFDSFRLFEIGREIHKRAEGLPGEITHFAAALYSKEDTTAGLFELKRLAECLAAHIDLRPAEARSFEHPMRTADVLANDEIIGRLFELHPGIIETGRAVILDIDLDRLEGFRSTDRRYKAVNRFPSSAFDLSVIAGSRDLVGDIQKQLTALAGPGLEHIAFVRQYVGPPLPEGKKSVSFRLTVAAPGRTFSSEEISAFRSAIIDGMRQHGYDLRV
ncbi:MAG: phenylalanine--tRNA ligase subunit beta [Bryobacteraceae bacterium]